MNVIVDNRQDFAELDLRIMESINRVIFASLEYEGIPDDCDISLSFVTNEEIRELNRDYRGIDSVTDVLSFPLFDEETDIDYGEVSLGDIVISVERATEQANEFGHSLEREICFLVCHSMFHLFGYDHMEEDEKKEMRFKEEEVLTKLGITRDDKNEK